MGTITGGGREKMEDGVLKGREAGEIRGKLCNNDKIYHIYFNQYFAIQRRIQAKRGGSSGNERYRK